MNNYRRAHKTIEYISYTLKKDIKIPKGTIFLIQPKHVLYKEPYFGADISSDIEIVINETFITKHKKDFKKNINKEQV